MPSTTFLFSAIVSASALVVVVYCGYIAATESTSLRTIRAKFITYLTISLWFCAASLFWILYDATRPIFELQGSIASVDVRDSDSRHYSAFILIHTTTGGDITVHASGRSDFFHAGQLLKVRYRGDTGELVRAQFYTPSGTPQGVFQDSSILNKSGGMLVGLVCIWASIRKYHRDLRSFKNTLLFTD